MKNVIGNVITLTVFGESHGSCIGGVLDGLPPGLRIDTGYIMREMDKRRPAGSMRSISTARNEADVPEFLSGVKDGWTEGTSLAFTIANSDRRSGDYAELAGKARPGHADYTAQMKYLGYQDARGGGHFSGRVTAVIVAAGAILKKALEDKGILIGTHIRELAGIRDADMDLMSPAADIERLNNMDFAVLSSDAAEAMMDRIVQLRNEGDSAGGILETAIAGLEAGIGEPLFSSVESELAAAMFSIGGVKGIEFGDGWDLAGMKGSEANDVYAVRDGRVVTLANRNGGINGGISNGMPVVFRTVVKPTPSIAKRQQTVDFLKMTDTEISIRGRHDPAIVHRARAVQDALTALVIADLVCQRYGYMWLREAD